MGVSSPTGEGQSRGMEWATQPGTPLPSRIVRNKMNQAQSPGTHDMDSAWAADARVDMFDDGKFTAIGKVPGMQGITNSRSGTGEMDMRVGGSPMQLKGKMNR